METIRNYIDTVFLSWPQDEATQRIKSNLLEIVEDKYQELIEQGKSEHEAIGQVISELGNVEELRSAPETVYVNADEVEVPDARQQMRRTKAWKGFMDDSYWVIVTVIYFVISFMTGRWLYTWLIFLLANVFEGAIRNFLGIGE